MSPRQSKTRITVSGSFHRHFEDVQEAVKRFKELDCEILSPAAPIIVEAQGDFLFVASDRLRSIALVQRRHFECIAASRFLWVECPDGYLGPSVAAEIGYAAAAGVQVFSNSEPLDQTLREFVTSGYSPEMAVEVARRSENGCRETILVDPKAGMIHLEAEFNRLTNALVISNPHTAEAQFSAAERNVRALLGDLLWTSRNSMH